MTKHKSTDSTRRDTLKSHDLHEVKAVNTTEPLKSELEHNTSLNEKDQLDQNEFVHQRTSTASEHAEAKLEHNTSLNETDKRGKVGFTHQRTATASEYSDTKLEHNTSLNEADQREKNEFVHQRTSTASEHAETNLDHNTSLNEADQREKNEFVHQRTATVTELLEPELDLDVSLIESEIELENIYRNQLIHALSKNYFKYKSQLSIRTLLLNPGSLEIYEFDNERKIIKMSDTFLHCMIEKNTPQDQIYEFISKIYQWLRFDDFLAHNYFSLQNSEQKTIIECIIAKYGNNFYSSLNKLWGSVFPNRLYISDEDHHTHSINQSVHNSYIRLFRNLFPKIRISINENRITFTRDQDWTNHINRILYELKSKVLFLLAENNLQDNLRKLYNNALPENFNRKVNIWRFRLNTVTRLLDDVINNQGFGTTYPIRPDNITNNGWLSIKEMIAICYKSILITADKTKRADTWHNPELHINHFFGFIKNLYLARRGYNTDKYDDRDYEIYQQQQENPNYPNEEDNITDQNRCETGMCNQIILGIKDHKLVEIVSINLQIFSNSIKTRLKSVLKNIWKDRPVIIKSSIEAKLISNNLINDIFFVLEQDKELIREYGVGYIKAKLSSALDLIGYDTIVSYLRELNIHIPLRTELLWRTFAFHEERGYIPYLEALYLSEPDTQNRDKLIRDNLFYVLEQRNSSKESIGMLEMLLSSSDSNFVSLIKSAIAEYLVELDRDPNYSFVHHAILTGSINLLTSIPKYAEYLQKEHLVIAIQNKNYEIFHLINEVKPDLISSINRTYLLVNAVIYGHPLILSDLCSLLNFTATELNIKDPNQDTLLILAIKNHQLPIAQILIEEGIDINAAGGENGLTAVHYASMHGMTEIINLLIKHKVEIDKLSEGKDTALMLAVINKITNAVISLINGGANINIQNAQGNTALHLATHNGFYDIVKILIKAGAHKNDRNAFGFAPFHQALHARDIELVNLLLEYNIDDRTDKSSNTELHLAILNDQTKKSIELIDQGVDINALNDMDDSALILAIHTGNNQVALTLINRNANLDIQDSHGKTALMWAIIHQNTELALTLINRNANLYINDNFGDTALSFAIFNNLTEVILTLIEKGACSELDPQQILTLQEKAMHYGNSHICIALIDKLNDTTVLQGNHFYIISAIVNNHLDVLNALIDKGADINAYDDNNNSALMIAIFKNSINLANRLIDLGAKLDSTSDTGYTALMWAIRSNNTDLANRLIKKGAKIYIQDNENKTAMIHAIEMSNIEVINAIIASERQKKKQDTEFHYEELRVAICFNNKNIVHTILTRAIEIMYKNTLSRPTIFKMIMHFDKYYERYAQYDHTISADNANFLYHVGLSMIIPQNIMNIALDGKNSTLLHLALKYGAHFDEKNPLELKTMKDMRIVLTLAKKGYIAKYTYNLNPDDQAFNEAAKDLDNTMNKIKSLKSKLAKDFHDATDHQKFIRTIRTPILESLQVNQKNIDEVTAARLNKKIQKEGQRVFFPKFTEKLKKERLSMSLTAISAKAVLLFSR